MGDEHDDRAARYYAERGNPGRTWTGGLLRKITTRLRESVPELRALVESVLNGHRPPGYESVFQAAEALQGWIARGVTPEVARQRLSRMTVAREWPEHWEILLSTWQVSLEQGSSLTGALTSDAYTVDFIGTVVAGPEGGAAASAGYLIGRLIRELL